MAVKRIDITHGKDEWVAKSSGRVIDRSPTKTDLVRHIAATARSSGEGTTVRIHDRDGRVQEERTYGFA